MGDTVGEATRCAKFGGDRFMGICAFLTIIHCVSKYRHFQL